MLQLKNHSPFSPAICLFPDENGIDTLYVVVKATFTMSPDVALAEEQIPPQEEDVYWGAPGESSLRYMSEMHLTKPATDIVVNGHAFAPAGTQVPQMMCGVRVGNYSKTIQVIGDRYWQGTQYTRPQPFTKIPLVFENAYGGSYIDEIDNGRGSLKSQPLLHTVNPVGRGYRKQRSRAENNEKLPNLESPQTLIRTPDDQPLPVGLGFVSPTWKPRVDYAGTYDDAWQKTRAPYLPTDFDNRFFNAAAAELTTQNYLLGGEMVTLVGLSPQGRLQFPLPETDIRCELNIADTTERPDFNLETVLFEPDENRFSMTWRAKFLCDKNALKIDEIHIRGGLNDAVAAVA